MTAPPLFRGRHVHIGFGRVYTTLRAGLQVRERSAVPVWNLTPFLLSVLHIFTALRGMQTRFSDENSVRPSVCPSVRLSVCHTRVL